MSRPGPRRTSSWAWALALAAGALAPFEASANGRFPNAGQLVTQPGAPATIMVQATYGVLRATDAVSFEWVCEQAVGYGGEQDPAIALAGDGTMFVAAFEGLSVSHDGGCTWALASGPLEGESTPDVTVDRSDPARVYAVTSTSAGGGFHVVVARSTDAGRSFEALAELPSDLLALTVEVAPSDPDRVYVSGLAGDTFTPVIERSDDGGVTFTRSELGLGVVGAPFVSGVDPSDPDRLYLRVDVEGDDALFVSDDGGVTATLAVTGVGDMLGFALSPDGQTVAIGGPQLGVRTAPAATLAFTDGARIEARCLHYNAEGLYACAPPSEGFVVGLSRDDGATFEPVLLASDVAPLACAPETDTGALCPAEWPAIAGVLGAGSEGGGGAGGQAAGGGGAGDGVSSGDGCDCAIDGSRARAPDGRSLLAVLALLALRARGGRRRPPARSASR